MRRSAIFALGLVVACAASVPLSACAMVAGLPGECAAVSEQPADCAAMHGNAAGATVSSSPDGSCCRSLTAPLDPANGKAAAPAPVAIAIAGHPSAAPSVAVPSPVTAEQVPAASPPDLHSLFCVFLI